MTLDHALSQSKLYKSYRIYEVAIITICPYDSCTIHYSNQYDTINAISMLDDCSLPTTQFIQSRLSIQRVSSSFERGGGKRGKYTFILTTHRDQIQKFVWVVPEKGVRKKELNTITVTLWGIHPIYNTFLLLHATSFTKFYIYILDITLRLRYNQNMVQSYFIGDHCETLTKIKFRMMGLEIYTIALERLVLLVECQKRVITNVNYGSERSIVLLL